MPQCQGPAGPIHFQSSGSGEPVVLLPGLGFAHAAWSYQIPALRPHCRIIALDPRGVGRSAAPPGPYSLHDMAEDVVEVLDALEVATATIVGMSLGGAVAQTLAIEFENRVNSLVLIATTSGHDGSVAVLCDDMESRARASGLPALFEHVFTQCYTPRFIESHAEQVAVLRRNMVANLPAEAGFFGQLAALRSCHTAPQLGKIRVPALVVAADEDKLFPMEHSQWLAGHLPDAELRTVPGGHACTVESPEAVNALLLEFLQRRSDTG